MYSVSFQGPEVLKGKIDRTREVYDNCKALQFVFAIFHLVKTGRLRVNRVKNDQPIQEAGIDQPSRK